MSTATVPGSRHVWFVFVWSSKVMSAAEPDSDLVRISISENFHLTPTVPDNLGKARFEIAVDRNGRVAKMAISVDGLANDTINYQTAAPALSHPGSSTAIGVKVFPAGSTGKAVEFIRQLQSKNSHLEVIFSF